MADAFDRRVETIRRLGELAHHDGQRHYFYHPPCPIPIGMSWKRCANWFCRQEILTVCVSSGAPGDEGTDLQVTAISPDEASRQTENALRKEEILPEFHI